MKQDNIKKIIAFVLISFISWWNIQLCFSQTQMYKHNVQTGETLFQISTKYGVDIESILAANPSLKKDGLKANTAIFIPIVDHKDGIKGTNCRLMHKVQKKETLWGIAKKYGITIEELLKANPDIQSENQGIKKGTFLCIPYASSEIVTLKELQTKGYDKINITLLLPLLNKNIECERSVEFYRGFLMAVEDMKKQNINIQINTFDEPNNGVSISDICEKIKKTNPQMVIGPLYPSHFKEIATLCKQNNNLKWVLPFSSKCEEVKNLHNVFLINAPVSVKAEFAAKLFTKNFNKAKVVFLHENNGSELAFSTFFRQKLQQTNFEIIDLLAGYTENLIKNLIKENNNLIFVSETSEENQVNSIVKLLSRMRQDYANKKFALFAHPDWLNLPNISANDLSKIDTYIYNNHFYNPYSNKTKELISSYSTWFKTQPLNITPRMCLLGYDMAIRLIEGLKEYGKDYNSQIIKTPSLQQNIQFIQYYKDAGYVNNSLYFIHYRPNGIIDLISNTN